MNDEPVILKARGLGKRFLFPALLEIFSGVDLTVCRGETLAIMGASGEGKSTLLHVLGTLEAPSEGSIEFFGRGEPCAKEAPRLRREFLGFIFQAFFLLEDYSALENVLMPARIARSATGQGRAAWRRANELLERVGLEQRANYSSKLLSGGEKQRVAIARALMNRPQLLFADEPSGNLDHTTSHSIHSLLLNLAKEEGTALVAVTHDDALAALCDSVLVLRKGRLAPAEVSPSAKD